MQFQDGIVVKGFVHNKSKKLLKDCKISLKVFSKTDSIFKRFFGLVKPKAKAEMILRKDLYPNTIGAFRLYGKRIKYTEDIDISLKTRCR